MEVCKASGGLGSELVQCHFHCIVLTKANHKYSLASWVGKQIPQLNRRGYKVALWKDVHTGKGIIVVIVASNIPKNCNLHSQVLGWGMTQLKIRDSIVMEVLEVEGKWGTTCIVYDTHFQRPVPNVIPPPGSLPWTPELELWPPKTFTCTFYGPFITPWRNVGPSISVRGDSWWALSHLMKPPWAWTPSWLRY